MDKVLTGTVRLKTTASIMKVIRFTDLEKRLRGKKASWKELLAPAPGAVSVLAIGRDGCPGCVRQKPALARLAKSMAGEYGGRISFSSVHISCPGGSREESVRSKKTLGHYFYPTIVVLIRAKDTGPVEYYRAISPAMSELRRYASNALRAAEALKKTLV